MDAKGMTDAYVRVKFAGKEVETKTINESLNPNFNNEFLFETTKDSLGQIMFELWDDDVPSDEFIGMIICKVATKNAAQLFGFPNFQFCIHDVSKNYRVCQRVGLDDCCTEEGRKKL